MSNPSSPAKSLITLIGQQGANSQSGFSGSSSGTSNSSSGAFELNAQQSSVAQAIGPGKNSPVTVAGAGAIIDFNRSIRTPKSYYLKRDGDFKTWVCHLEHYFTLLNVGDGRKSTVLLYYLGDNASNIASI